MDCKDKRIINALVFASSDSDPPKLDDTKALEIYTEVAKELAAQEENQSEKALSQPSRHFLQTLKKVLDRMYAITAED
ncbi:MAG: hypothetical protein PHO56_02510 [Patescibacteria group bacterium]|nr:hypothetical protein [Patescibacteria group bacterium]